MASDLRWFFRLPAGSPESQATLSLVTGTHVFRLVVATVVAGVLLFQGRFVADPPPSFLDLADARVVWLWLVASTLLLTGLHFAWLVRRGLRSPSAAEPPFMLTGGALDLIWLFLGWGLLSLSPMPFLPLVVLALGVYGFLLTVPRHAVLLALALLFFLFFRNIQPPLDTTVSGEIEAALFLGAGLVSAIAGNRIRAASWTADQLRRGLRDIESHQRMLLDRIPVGLYLVRGSGGEDPEVDWNQALLDLLELPPAASAPEVRARFRDRFPDIEISSAPTSLATSSPRTGSLDLDLGAGEVRRIVWRVSHGHFPNLRHLPSSALTAFLTPRLAGSEEEGSDSRHASTLPGVLVVVMDRTDAYARERAEALSEHFRAIAEISAGLAHEVRNPVAGIASAADQLAEDADDPEIRDRLLSIIQRESRRLNGLVSDFLEYSRTEVGETRPVRLHDAVEDAVASVLSAWDTARDEAPVSVSGPDTEVQVASDLLHRALVNILSNALQFSPAGEDVHIETDVDADAVIIRVRDRGPGVPDALRHRIFQPFVTSRAPTGGSGLGLSIAHRSIDALGGTLWLDELARRDDEGAVFSLRLPRTP